MIEKVMLSMPFELIFPVQMAALSGKNHHQVCTTGISVIRFPTQVAEMVNERGIEVAYTTI